MSNYMGAKCCIPFIIINQCNTNKEKIDYDDATFLDLSIKVRNKVFHTSLYNKQDAFPFNIVNFPYLSGNLSNKTSYDVFIAQVLKFPNMPMLVWNTPPA